MDTPAKTKLDALKTVLEKVVDKADEARSEFVGNKIADKIVKPKPVPNNNLRNIEEIIIPPEKEKKYWTNWENYYNNESTIKYLNF